MHLRALLVCEDVRVEVDGTLTLVGMYNDRLPVRRPPGASGALRIEHLSFLLVVGGLTGVERVGFHERVQPAELESAPAETVQHQPHAVDADEHNFVFGYAPLEVAGFGTYVFVATVVAGRERAVFQHRFRVEASPFL